MSNTKTTSAPKRHAQPVWRILLTIALLAVAIYLLLSHRQTLQHSLRLVQYARPDWLLLAVLLTAATFIIAATIYGLLALRPLRYRQTLLVELASAFANRLLPAGLGALGLHGLYLHRRKHSVAEATAVVSVNNLLGIVAHLLLLVVLVVVRPHTLHAFAGRHITFSGPIVTVVVLLVVLLMAVPASRRKLVRFAANLLESFRHFRLHRLVAAFGLAVLLTCTYTCILFSAARALDLSLSLLQAFVVFTIGMVAATATPTPGGLIGAEAGLFAALIAYHVASPAAAACVLIYRLATYWLPLIPGGIALLLARQRKLV